jgi:hypothetical protein
VARKLFWPCEFAVVERYGVAEEDIVELADDAFVEEEDIPASEAIRALEILKLFEIRPEDGLEAFYRLLIKLTGDI